MLGINLVLGIGVVQGTGQFFVGSPLKRQLAVDPLAVEIIQVVLNIGGDSVDTVSHFAGEVDRRWIAHRDRAPLSRSHTVIYIVLGDEVPAHKVLGSGRLGTPIPLLAAQGERHADGILGKGLAEQSGIFRADTAAFAGAGIVNSLGTDHGAEAGHLQGLAGLYIDHSTNTAGGDIGTARLVDLHRRYTLGGDIAKVEGTAAGGGHLPAVEGDNVEVRTKAPNRDLGALTPIPLDGDTGDSLQRFSQVGVRELTHILSGDAVDNTFGIALDIHRALQAGADTGDYHLLHQLIRIVQVIIPFDFLGTGASGASQAMLAASSCRLN